MLDTWCWKELNKLKDILLLSRIWYPISSIPECGSKNPECGSKNPECGSKNSKCGSKNLKCGTENPASSIQYLLTHYLCRMNIKAFSSSFITKFIFLKRAFGKKPFRLLDIGAGNHSATKAKTVFPNCEYHGVDMERDTTTAKQI